MTPSHPPANQPAKLLFLGTGNSESLNNFNSNVLIIGQTKNILIDCGWTIKLALRNVNLSIDNIDAIFVTHVHGDHVFGLERLAFESKYKYGHRIDLYLEEGIYEELWDKCLRGSLEWTSEGPNSLDDFFNVIYIRDRSFCIDGIQFNTFGTIHEKNKPTYGLIINNDTIFTSDTKALDWMADTKMKLYIHDVTTQEGNPAHAGINELIKNYPKSVRKRMMLTHYDDDIYQYLKIIESDFMGLAATGQVIPV